MNQPVRRENGRRRNAHESIGRDVHDLWKTLKLSSERHCGIARIGGRPRKRGTILPVRSQAAQLRDGFAQSIFRARVTADFVQRERAEK
jgi:hypothetical protein